MTDSKEKVETKVVPILEETIRASDIVLADGTMLSVKPVIKFVKRVVGKFNGDGDPLYHLSGDLVVTTITAKRGK